MLFKCCFLIDFLSDCAGFPRWCSGQRILLPVQETLETRVQFLGQEDPLEEGTASYSSILT